MAPTQGTNHDNREDKDNRAQDMSWAPGIFYFIFFLIIYHLQHTTGTWDASRALGKFFFLSLFLLLLITYSRTIRTQDTSDALMSQAPL